MRPNICAIYLLIFFLFFPNFSIGDKLQIGNFSGSNLDGWEEKKFKGATSYNFKKVDSKIVLMAESVDSASGLVQKKTVNLEKYPYLNWSWRVEQKIKIEDEKVKSGDDYAGRIYVVIDGGVLIWKTRVVNYVWASAASKGTTWPNAFAGKNAMMMALRNKLDHTDTWYIEKRNVYEDLKALFGADYSSIDAIALMTDTDNSHSQAKMYYGDIFFSTD